jgi:hypothetical protein
LLPTLQPNWSVGAVGDYDGDGRPDLLVQNSAAGRISLMTVVNMKITQSLPVSPAPLPGWILAGPR